MDIDLTDQMTWPNLETQWRHRNGNVYKVLFYTNIEPGRQTEYPTTVVYENVANGNRYSRRLVDWHRSMTPLY